MIVSPDHRVNATSVWLWIEHLLQLLIPWWRRMEILTRLQDPFSSWLIRPVPGDQSHLCHPLGGKSSISSFFPPCPGRSPRRFRLSGPELSYHAGWASADESHFSSVKFHNVLVVDQSAPAVCEDVALSLRFPGRWWVIHSLMGSWGCGRMENECLSFLPPFFPPPLPRRDREHTTGHLSAASSELLTSGCLHRGWPHRFAIHHARARRAGACGHRGICVERSEPATTEIKIKMKLCASVYLCSKNFKKGASRCLPPGEVALALLRFSDNKWSEIFWPNLFIYI